MRCPLLIAVLFPIHPACQATDLPAARDAVSKALVLLERGSAGSAEHRQCFTCHSQAMPVFTFVEARHRGFQIDDKNLQRQLHHTHRFLKRGKSNYDSGRGQGGGVDTAGYALWTLEDGDREPDEVTDAVVAWLLSKQDKKGQWRTSSNRPPSERSNFTATYLALRAIEQFGGDDTAEAFAASADKARGWLKTQKTVDTEDRVFKLLSLLRIDDDADAAANVVNELRAAQRDDGGWAQTAEMNSDAYATGTVLYALHQAEVPTSDSCYQRGIDYLLRTQLPDGSWHVVSRSKPFQTYFETGFPHGKDQFISTTATAWAALAVLLTLPEADPPPAENGDGPMLVWPGLAPGETSDFRGELLPARPNETKPVQRVKNVRLPTMDVYPAKNPNGTGVLILPGGGFNYVVPNLEGSEAAEWLNTHGVSVFVLRYRTKESVPEGEPMWRRPAQDAQRALRVIRAGADKWGLNSDRLGLLAFSAGGQVGSIVHTTSQEMYKPIDETDKLSCRPDFSMLVYPWRLLDAETNELRAEIKVTPKTRPAFIVHTHDDGSTAVGPAKLYIALKENKVPAELHIYQNGGHGYGTRPRPNSVISTWPDRATEWMRIRRLIDNQERAAK